MRIPDEAPDVYVMKVGIGAGDRFLLCSDGLTDMVRRHLAANGSLENVSRHLIAAANARGGHDNITVVAVELDERRRGRRMMRLTRRIRSMISARG